MIHLLGGCSNGAGGGLPPVDGGGDGPDMAFVQGATADQACTDLAMARCAKRDACTNQLGVMRAFGSLSTCLAREKLSCMIGLAAPSTGNSPDAVERCVAAYGGFGCADFLLNNPPPACVATGLLPAGGACAFNGQCQSTYCIHDKISACGVCGQPPSTGASCASEFCARGQVCLPASDTCVLEGTAGSGCDAANPCGPDLSCVGATMTAMGVCQAAVATSGAACVPNQSTGPGCDANYGLHCEASLKTCQAIQYVGDGNPCGVLGGGVVAECLGGGMCVIPTGTKMGVCKAPASDGSPCDTANGPPCLTPARCVVAATGTAGTCIVPDATTCK